MCELRGRAIGWTVFAIVMIMVIASATQSSGEEVSQVNPTFTILFDNVPFRESFRSAWGYSCLIEGLDKTVLFDTGADGRILLDNLEMQGIDTKDIDVIVLSHFHGDHTGGIHDLLPRCDKVTVYLLETFPTAFKDEVRTMASEVVEVVGPIEVAPGVQSTGKLGSSIPEQSLVIDVAEGTIVVTGCAHPGLIPICRRAQEIAGEDPIFLMGGFHLRDYNKSRSRNLIDNLKPLGLRGAAPSHCTGGVARHTFAEMFEDKYLESGVGRVITMDEIREVLRP